MGMWEHLKEVNICVVFKNSVYMFCMECGIEEVRLNTGMCEDLKVANICVVFLQNSIGQKVRLIIYNVFFFFKFNFYLYLFVFCISYVYFI